MTRPNVSTAALAMIGMIGIPITAYAAADPAAKSSEYYTKKVCRSEKSTGSRLGGVRRCRSEAEWAEYRREQKDVVDKMQTLKPTSCPPAC